jgi:broad specificity phosphatase PhoE
MTLSAIVLLFAVAQAGAEAAAPAGAGVTTVVLVRHAEKADDPKDPGLSPAGQKRAEALVDELSHLKIGTIIVSDTKRARETAAPLAQARGLKPVEVSVAEGPDAHAKGVVAAIQALPPGTGVLVVGHSNTLAPVVAVLGGPDVRQLCEKQFAVMYVLELREGGSAELKTKSYGEADPPNADACQ